MPGRKFVREIETQTPHNKENHQSTLYRSDCTNQSENSQVSREKNANLAEMLDLALRREKERMHELHIVVCPDKKSGNLSLAIGNRAYQSSKDAK